MAACIGWASFTGRLSDGDEISVLDQAGADSNQIEFILQIAENITWWKGLKFFFGDGTLFGEVSIADHKFRGLPRSITDPIRVPADQTLLRGARLELCKAKKFGVHTGMYCLCERDLLARRGRRITFVWRRD